MREEVFGPIVAVVPFRDEEDAVAARQRHDLRALRIDLDPRRRRGRCASRARSRPASCRSTRNSSVRVSHAVRGLQAVRLRARARPARARRVHRGQDDLLQHEARRQGRRLGARRRHRRCDAELFAREGAHGVGVDLLAGLAGRALARGRRHRRAAGDRHVRRRGSASVASTCSSTTPGSRRPTTRRCSTRRCETWQRVQDVNLKSVFVCCKHGIPHLLANDPSGGSVINTASFVAVMGAATSQISYTASKGGVLSLSRELGVEFARQACGSTRCAPVRSTRRCCGSSSPRTPNAPRAGSCTADRALRPCGGDRSRRALPGERRLDLRERDTFLVDGGLRAPTRRRCSAHHSTRLHTPG